MRKAVRSKENIGDSGWCIVRTIGEHYPEVWVVSIDFRGSMNPWESSIGKLRHRALRGMLMNAVFG